ncbi:MAG: exodeoxyribonuclease III [Bacillota bacterium]|jgi:exodeoxyribonuclease-3|nr:exodeoxyribonuclease III [Bacillota bacterium]NLP22478.1 exodeoxyribonuclease III [Erysipelotrichaceae bacterium]
MKLISWNVNGLRAVVKKGFMDFFDDIDADIFALQETKMQPHQLELDLPGYYQYFHSAERKGYSGTAVFTKKEPINVSYDFEKDIHNDEGRVMTLEYDDFYFVNAYVPNSQEKLKRLDYRMEWEDELRNYLVNLDKKKPVIYCGDLNVAHNEIDLKNPSTNRKNAGFSDEERAKFSELLDAGFSDTFRTLYPDKVEYSWWSYRFNARANNAGWRIDYFVVSDRLMDKVKDSIIYGDIMGSDHCPVGLKISMK